MILTVRLASNANQSNLMAKHLSLDDKSAMQQPTCDSTTPDNMVFNRPSHTSKVRVEEEPCSSQSIGTVVFGPCKNMGVKRVYNKRHHCLYCSKPYAEMARHLECAHEDKFDVVRALIFPKGSKERKRQIISGTKETMLTMHLLCSQEREN